MIKVLSCIALVVTILAGGALFYRIQPYSIKLEHESAGEVKKVQEKVSASPAPVRAPEPFGPVPNVVVQSMPTPAPTPAAETAPTPAQVKKVVKRKPKPSAAKKLKAKWTAPVAKPFSFGDLFNVK